MIGQGVEEDPVGQLLQLTPQPAHRSMSGDAATEGMDALHTAHLTGVHPRPDQIHQFVGEVVAIGVDGGKPLQTGLFCQPGHGQAQRLQLASVPVADYQIHTVLLRQPACRVGATVFPVDGHADGHRIVNGGDAGRQIVIEQQQPVGVVVVVRQVDGNRDAGSLPAGLSGNTGVGCGQVRAHRILIVYRVGCDPGHRERQVGVHWHLDYFCRLMLTATEQPLPSTAELLDDAPILVVDDDEALRRLCARVLSSRGYEVHTAEDGEEAVRKVQIQAYRVVLLDLKMPGMDGIECLKRMKSEGCRADVVMITGYGNVPTAVEAMKVGARDFIEKPFKPQDLQAMLEDILQRQSRDAQLSSDPVVAFIQQHATEISSRKDVANRLGVSLERVSTRVQEETSLSFRAFLHACRLDLAKRLLETTELDISEISTRTGFQTVQHFSRVFSKRSGISPKKYRLQVRAEA
ncbi:MAG: hypothetical protein CME04_01995 [Gemmatimonadaceae bacterium]|nr:hypothetical protein [Gemmatimonadaceae bacterium]